MTQILTPKPNVDGTTWAEQNLHLTSEDSSEVGRYTTSRAPWQRFILNALSAGEYKFFVLMTSSQVGKTTLLKADIGRTIDIDPCGVLVVQPTEAMAKTFSTDRFTPMIAASPALRGKIKQSRQRDSGNKLLYKKFPGGHLTFVGGNSASALKMRPIRKLYLDEINEYPVDVGGQGDPVDVAVKRTQAFEDERVVFLTSTPTTAGRGRIEKWFENSTQFYFHVPCPECGHYQVLDDRQFRYKGERPDEVKEVNYECIKCACIIPETAKYDMIAKYKPVAKNPKALIFGAHVWQAYNFLNSWVEIVREYLNAKSDRDKLKVYHNQTLGKSWEERSDAPDWASIYDRRERYEIGVVPDECVILTAFIDVQKDRFEIEVKGYAPDMQTFSIDYFTINGSVTENDMWDKLSAFVNSTYRHASGVRLHLSGIGIDTGYETQRCYYWVRQQDPSRVFATKGHSNFNAPALGMPKHVDLDFRGQKVQNGVKLWMLGASTIKSEIYSLIRLRPVSDGIYPPRYYHFPQYGEDYFKSLTSESIVWRGRSVKKPAWEKYYERNEILDLNAGNRAVTLILGLERLSPDDWRQIRESVIGNVAQQSQGRERLTVAGTRARVVSRGLDD